jgi:hypothetical protein
VSDIYAHYLQIPADEALTPEQFENISVIITTYLYQLTNYCSYDSPRNLSASSYSYFVEELKAIRGSSKVNSSLFTIVQLRQLMRLLSQSYMPGDQYECKTKAARDLLCAVGNTKVTK